MESPAATKDFGAEAASQPSDFTHYQFVSSTLYPETRKRLAALHAQKSMTDFASPGWVIGAESRASESPEKIVAEQ